MWFAVHHCVCQISLAVSFQVFPWRKQQYALPSLTSYRDSGDPDCSHACMASVCRTELSPHIMCTVVGAGFLFVIFLFLLLIFKNVLKIFSCLSSFFPFPQLINFVISGATHWTTRPQVQFWATTNNSKRTSFIPFLSHVFLPPSLLEELLHIEQLPIKAVRNKTALPKWCLFPVDRH